MSAVAGQQIANSLYGMGLKCLVIKEMIVEEVPESDMCRKRIESSIRMQALSAMVFFIAF